MKIQNCLTKNLKPITRGYLYRVFFTLSGFLWITACQTQPGGNSQTSATTGVPSMRPLSHTGSKKRPVRIKTGTKKEVKKPKTIIKPVEKPKKSKITLITPGEAAKLLYPENGTGKVPLWESALNACPQKSTPASVRCLLKTRYKKDTKAKKLALELYKSVGIVAGLRPPQVRDGGWRGRLRMVPELPINRRRKHLRWVTAVFKSYKQFFASLDKVTSKPRRYRYTNISFKFYHTIGKRTPSASAWEWNIAYNLNGSLLKSEDGVRKTLYHELFHLNDADHGNWSEHNLKGLYTSILKRCKPYMRNRNRQGAKYQRCLRPYAPNKTKVIRDNVFYAFHRGSDVGEYAAELALRYFLEQRAVILKLSSKARKRQLGYCAPGAFKCGPKENAKAWNLMKNEFFGGADLTSPCP